MKIQIALFVMSSIGVLVSAMIGDKCWSHSECNVRECCAGVSTKTTGACAHQPQMGQKCFPWIHPRSKVHCPCILGTTCSGENYDLENTTRQFRCAKVVYEPDEEIESVNDFN